MAIYLSRKKGGVTPTSITPSNSSPAALTANSAVTPTANGYAIASYTDLVPASYSKPVYQNDIYKMVDDGFVVDMINGVSPSDSNPPKLNYLDVYTPSSGDGYLCEHAPTSVTPSNANPVHISNLELFYSTLNGTLIDELTNITPSDSSPVTLSSGSIYKMSGAGKAVASVTSKTPSDSSPASVSSGAIIKASASGYLYSSSGLKNVPTYFSGISATTSNSSGTNSVSVTNGKKYLFIALRHSTSGTASDTGVSSGATVDKVYVNNVATNNSRVKLYVAMVTATSSTISALGTGNICSVLPLN